MKSRFALPSRPSLPATLALAASAVLAGCAHTEVRAQERVATPIAIETARQPAPAAIYRGPGTVQAAHTYRVGFEISGRVGAVNVDVGDRVRAGEVLASIDASDYRAQYEAAQARVAVADAAALKARNGARPEERLEAQEALAARQAALDRALAARDLAAKNDARSQSLVVDGDVPVAQADGTHAALLDAEAQVRAARADLAAAQQALNVVRTGTRDEDLRAAAGDAAAARANAQLALVTLAKSSIVAPADAFVQSRAIEPGDDAQPGTVAFVLTSAAEPDVVVNVPETRLGALRPGTPASIDTGTSTVRGAVTRIEPSADSATHSALVRIHPAGPRLQPGSVVEVVLGSRPLHGASVSAGALIESGGSFSVDVFDAAGGTVVRRSVRVLDTDGDRAVVSGLAPGERVVVAGQHDVVPGEAVRVVER
jgi:HlyD family secretion protein